MTKLEILRKCEGTRSGHVSIRLEHVHGKGVSWEEETTNELSQHVEGDRHIRDCVDDTGKKVSYGTWGEW